MADTRFRVLSSPNPKQRTAPSWKRIGQSGYFLQPTAPNRFATMPRSRRTRDFDFPILQDADFVYFYPEAKHRRYWKSLKLPVILVLHDPVTETTLYAPIGPQLTDGGTIKVDKRNRFIPESRTAIQSCCEIADFDPTTVLSRLHDIKLARDGGKSVTGIEFLLACTNREDSYFELRMCRVSALLDMVNGTEWFSTVASHYEFVLRNVFAILESQLTENFREQFDKEWLGLEVVPDIIVPLTYRGESVVKCLWDN